MVIGPRSRKFSPEVEDWGGASLTVKLPIRYLVWGVKPAAGADFCILWSFQQRSHARAIVQIVTPTAALLHEERLAVVLAGLRGAVL